MTTTRKKPAAKPDRAEDAHWRIDMMRHDINELVSGLVRRCADAEARLAKLEKAGLPWWERWFGPPDGVGGIE